MKKTILAFALAALGTGCISFNETEFPAAPVVALPPGKGLAVQVAGYDATITTYVPVLGYSTVVGESVWYGRHGRHCHSPFLTTVATETYVPQATPTAAFRDRATETLEKCGYTLKTATPRFRVEVVFGGPFSDDSDLLKEVCWNLLSLLTADYDTQTWTAKLKVYDVASGRLVFFQDYVQKYEVNVWGPIPLFSPMGSSKTKFNAMQSWCLTALTDRTLADATDFLNKQVK